MENDDKKDKIASLGHFTINPFHLKKVLTTQEYELFDLIRYQNAISNGYISYSLIQLEVGIKKRTLISKTKKNLIKLGFISVVSESRTKGTLYKVNINAVCEIIKKLNEEYNSVTRLKIADKYRTDKGLDSILSSSIKQFQGSNFDVALDNNRFIVGDNAKHKQIGNNKIINELNKMYDDFINGKIGERQYKIQHNNLRAKQKEKIIFNKEIEQWIIQPKSN